MRGGCESCPVHNSGCSAAYRGSECAALRAKAGVDYDPMTNAEMLAKLLDEPARYMEWLKQPASKDSTQKDGKKYAFNIVLGDYFGTGHGHTETFHVCAEKPFEEVVTAHNHILENTGIDLTNIAAAEHDDLLSEDTKLALLDLGYQFHTELYEDESGTHFQTADLQCDCPEELAAIWVFLLNYVDPDLHCTLNDIPTLVQDSDKGCIGYGLF